MNLAFASTMSSSAWGGSEELWASAALAARQRGLRVGVFAYEWEPLDGRLQHLRAVGAELNLRRTYRRHPLRILHGGMTGCPHTLKGQLRKFDPSLVVVCQGGTYDVAGDAEMYRDIACVRCPIVILCQYNHENVVPAATRLRARELFGRAALVAFVSEANRRAAERQCAMSIPNCLIAQNPINLQNFDPVPWPRSETPRWACVARLEAGAKGQDLLLEALGTKEWRSRDWRLMLYGRGTDLEYLRELVDFYRLADHVEFGGHVSDVAAVWRDHHMLVLPSRSEGLPLALMEAAIAGRPAVVTDVGDSGVRVTDGVTGFVAPCATVATIRCALERAWRSRANWQAIGQAAHQAARAIIDPLPGVSFLEHALKSYGAT